MLPLVLVGCVMTVTFSDFQQLKSWKIYMHLSHGLKDNKSKQLSVQRVVTTMLTNPTGKSREQL